MSIIQISVKVTAPDGVVDEQHEEYEYSDAEPEGGKRTYWSLYRHANNSIPSRGMGYSGAASDEDFKAQRQEAMRKQCDERFKMREAERKRAAEVAKFDLLLPNWQGALDGLQDKDDIVKALRHACEWHSAYDSLSELVHSEKPKVLRTILRNVYKEARTEAREQYEEEYRDAEEKEDFYEDHADDIAEYMAGNL